MAFHRQRSVLLSAIKCRCRCKRACSTINRLLTPVERDNSRPSPQRRPWPQQTVSVHSKSNSPLHFGRHSSFKAVERWEFNGVFISWLLVWHNAHMLEKFYHFTFFLESFKESLFEKSICNFLHRPVPLYSPTSNAMVPVLVWRHWGMILKSWFWYGINCCPIGTTRGILIWWTIQQFHYISYTQ